MIFSRCLFALAVAAILSSAAPSFADVDKMGETGKPAVLEDRKQLSEVSAYTRYLPYSTVDRMPGKIGIMQAGFEYDLETKCFGKLPVYLAATYDYMNIDKTVTIPLPVSLMNIGFDIDTRFPLFCLNGFYAGIGITPSLACDNESFGLDAFLIPTRAYLIYTVCDNLIIAGGAVFFSDFDNNILPAGGIIYRPNNRLTFNLLMDDPNITYKLNDRVDIFAEAGYSVFTQFKVHRQSDNNVKLEYTDLSFGGGLNFRPVKHITTSVSVGGDFVRRLEYPDAGGKMDIDKGMYVQGKIQANF